MNIKKHITATIATIAFIANLNAPLLPLDLERKVFVHSVHSSIYPNYYAIHIDMVEGKNILSFQCVNLSKEDLKGSIYSRAHKIEDIFNDKTYICEIDIRCFEDVGGPLIVFGHPIKISFTKENLEKLLAMINDGVSVAPEDRYSFSAQWLVLNFGFDSHIDAEWQRELFITGTGHRCGHSFI